MFFTQRVVGQWKQAPQGKGHGTSLIEFNGLGNALKLWCDSWGWCCDGPGAELDDPVGLLPTQHIV